MTRRRSVKACSLPPRKRKCKRKSNKNKCEWNLTQMQEKGKFPFFAHTLHLRLLHKLPSDASADVTQAPNGLRLCRLQHLRHWCECRCANVCVFTVNTHTHKSEAEKRRGSSSMATPRSGGQQFGRTTMSPNQNSRKLLETIAVQHY